MRPQAVAIAAVLALIGLWALLGVLNRHEIGQFARSPQVLEVPLGARRIAGGGRALVGAVSLDKERVVLDVSCRDVSRRLTANVGEPFEDVCGVNIIVSQVLGYVEDADRPQRLLLSIVWDEPEVGDPQQL